MVQMASAQLARRYGVPSNIGTFATGAKSADWQAGVENGLSVVASWLGGADMLCGAGLLYGARVYSIVELLLDTELFDLVRYLTGGVRVDDETLALEAIEAVGPGGHFLAQPQTLRNMRRRWDSQVFGRQTWEAWEEAGRPDPRDRARERARAILAEHRPIPLPDGAEERIQEVIDAYGR
jgi:trimethylamine--corrinoid protein Co-methyltransferase